MESTRVSVTEGFTGVNSFQHTFLNQETISKEFHLESVSIQPLPLPFMYSLIRLESIRSNIYWRRTQRCKY